MKSAIRSSKNSPARFVEPMKALLVDAPSEGQWLYEVKFDGFRALAIKNGKNVQLLSRNQNDMSEKFPGVIDALKKVKANSAVIDGEIVIVDTEGKSSFQELQSFQLGGSKGQLAYFAFDLINVDGEDLRGEGLSIRRARLKKVLKPKDPSIHFSTALEGDVNILLGAARKAGLEGLIGKRADSLYETGKRTGSWIKLKINNEQELVIGGYTRPGGARVGFGAILVGYYQKGEFKFAGKVGTGFNEKILTKLLKQFQKIEQKECPFPDLPEKKLGRYGSGITKSVMKECTWLKPSIVCQVKFTEWTKDGKLRHPVFLGVREDKGAKQVVREMAK